MAETHVISALTNKRSELLGDIKHYESIIKSLKDNLSTISKTIHIFDENYKLSSIKAKNVKKNKFFETGEATKALLDTLRNSDRPLLIGDIVEKVIRSRDMVLSDLETQAVKKSLGVTLNSLRKKGLVSKEGETSHTSMWSIAEIYAPSLSAALFSPRLSL
jgi:hypothetical protein